MQDKKQLTHQVVADLLEAYPACHSLDLAFAGCACRLYSNSPALLDELRRHYQAFAKERITPSFLITLLDTPPFLLDSAYDLHAGELTISGDLADELEGRLVHDRAAGMISLSDDRQHLLMGPVGDRPEAAIALIFEVYQLWQREVVLA